MNRSTRRTTRGSRRALAHAGDDPATAPHTLNELMTEALIMEVEGAQRYLELAGIMETRDNVPMAVLFRKMARTEGKHAEQIMHEMGWATAPAAPGKRIWEGFEAPESIPRPDLTVYAQPWHALAMALAAEQRAEQFFARLAQEATVEAVRNAARELQREEEDHVELIREWMTRVAPPLADAGPAAPPRLLD